MAHSIIDRVFLPECGNISSYRNSENTCDKGIIPTVKQPLQTTSNSEPNNDYVNNIEMSIQGPCSSSHVFYDQHCVSSKVPTQWVGHVWRLPYERLNCLLRYPDCQ